MKTKTSSKKVPTPFSLRQSVSRPFPLAPTLVAAALVAAFFVMAFAPLASASGTPTPNPTATATPTPTPTATPIEPGRMTGGGSIQCGDIGRVTHGFELHCIFPEGTPPIEPNNLEINWDGGNNFHLTTLNTAICTDNPLFDEKPPPAGFDTMEATGTGLLNGVPGATIEFTLIDDGEPGAGADMARFFIQDANGNVVLDCPLTVLDQGGNHQAHTQNP